MTKDTQLLRVRAGVQTRAPGFTFQAAPTNTSTPTPRSMVGLGRITITQSVVILQWPPGFSLRARCCVRPASSVVKERHGLQLGEDTG